MSSTLVSAAELAAHILTGESVDAADWLVVDCRFDLARPSSGEADYAAAHIPGAINVPLDKLESYLSRLPKRKEVVAYCRGPYCLMSFEAVATLRKRGWRARRLENGLPEWRAAGLPVER